jgi:hypothetical protein
MDPIDMHCFNPWFSMTQIDKKFIGKYNNMSAYLAICRVSLSMLLPPMLSMISLLVERLPVRAPVEQEAKKYVKSTTHLNL